VAGVVFNGLWIGGLAVVLAALSYHHWLAGESSRRLKDVLALRAWTVCFSGGMILVCAGLGYVISDRWWQGVLWIALAVLFAHHLATDLGQRRAAAASAKRAS
jgi:hypothetical protein